MSQETVLFKREQRLTREQAAAMLRQVADRVEQGVVTLSQGEERVELALPAILTVEVKAEEATTRRGQKHSLELELEWRDGNDASNEPLLIQ